MLIYRHISDNEIDASVRLMISGSREPEAIDQEEIGRFKDTASTIRCNLACQIIALDQDKIIGCLLYFPSPDASALITMPKFLAKYNNDKNVAAILHCCIKEIPKDKVDIIQTFIDPSNIKDLKLLTEAGFSFFGDIILMKRQPSVEDIHISLSKEIEWRNYSGGNHTDFLRVLKETYEGTLDFVRLPRSKDIEKIVAGHKSIRLFREDCWFSAHKKGSPVGVLLLNYLPFRKSFNLTYMGVVKDMRGKGYGKELVKKAIQICSGEQKTEITLAVDPENIPAYRIYKEMGFEEKEKKKGFFALTI